MCAGILLAHLMSPLFNAKILNYLCTSVYIIISMIILHCLCTVCVQRLFTMNSVSREWFWCLCIVFWWVWNSFPMSIKCSKHLLWKYSNIILKCNLSNYYHLHCCYYIGKVNSSIGLMISDFTSLQLYIREKLLDNRYCIFKQN